MKVSTLRLMAFLFGLISLGISVSVPIFRFRQTPAGRIFGGHQFYTDDYNAYAETIRQGMDGRWTVVDKFTSEPHQPSLFRIFYLLLGKFIGTPIKPMVDRFGLQPTAIVYLLSRIVLSAGLLFLIWQFIKRVLPGASSGVWLSAWALVLFANVWPRDLSALFSFPWDWRSLLPYFREPEVTTRFFSQPHYLAGYIITFITLIFIIQIITALVTAKKNFVFLFLLGFLGSWIEPTPVVLVAITLWVYSGLLALIFFGRTGQWQRVKVTMIAGVIVSFSLVPATLYYQSLRQQLPWSNNSIYESHQDFYLQINEFLPILGLPFILGLAGIGIVLTQKEQLAIREVSLFLLSFVIGFFLLFYPLASEVGINRLRILRQPVFVVFDIFAVIAISWLAQKISELKSFPVRIKSITVINFIIFITIMTILPGVSSALAFLRDQYLEYRTIPSFAYPPSEELDAFRWLESHVPKDSTVAALYEAGSLIPQFSGNTTYLGNVVETINFGQKTDLLGKFFAGQMDASQAKQFLTDGRINYLYWGFQERSLGGNPLSYNFVSQVYANSGVTIFRVSPKLD